MGSKLRMLFQQFFHKELNAEYLGKIKEKKQKQQACI
jgi:hypothetical protein